MQASTVFATILVLAVVALTRASKPLENAKGVVEHQRVKRSADDPDVKNNERRYIGPICRGGSNDELCCNNTVFRGQFDYSAQCCGDDFYDTSTARCCNDQIMLTTDYNCQCCGDDLYDQTKQVCCNGVAYDIETSQQCCDTSAYDPLIQICCDGVLSDIGDRVLSCCGSTPYEPNVAHCVDGEIQDSSNPEGVTQVCGSDMIDFESQICCNDKPLSRPNEPTTVCCGDATISASTQLCCNGTVISNPPDNAQCCVKTSFDPNTQVCCNGKVYPRPENSVGTIDYCNTVIAGAMDGVMRYSPYFGCCGDQLYTQYDTQQCCVDQLYSYRTSQERYSYSCCASTAYKTAEQTCCLDTLFPGGNLRCCGNATFDLNSQVCCGDELFSHGRVPADKCCASTQNIIYPIEY